MAMARNYEMFNPEGNALVAEMVQEAVKLPMTTTNQELYKFITEKMNAIAKFHGEVWDTAVREALIGDIERQTGRQLSIYF